MVSGAGHVAVVLPEPCKSMVGQIVAGREGIPPEAVEHQIISHLLKNLPTPFLSSDIYYKDGWLLFEDIDRLHTNKFLNFPYICLQVALSP